MGKRRGTSGVGAWDKMMRFLGFGPDEDELEEEAAAAAEAQEEPLRRALGAGSGSRSSRPVGVAANPGLSSAGAANVVPIGAAQSKQPQAPFKVLVVEPQKFEDVQAIADQLKNRRPIILNLEGLDKDVAQKVLVFLQGAIYALNGETAKIATGIFFFAPPGVDVTSFGQGFRGTAAGGAYDEAEIAEILAGASRLPLGNDRPTYNIPERTARPADDKKDVRSRPDWDWRR